MNLVDDSRKNKHIIKRLRKWLLQFDYTTKQRVSLPNVETVGPWQFTGKSYFYENEFSAVSLLLSTNSTYVKF